MKPSIEEKSDSKSIFLLLSPELNPETRDQSDQRAAQAVGTVSDAKDGEGQGEDE